MNDRAGRFAGKVVVVTAGGAGIGAATARRFAGEGAAVVVADISGRRAAAVAEISRAGGRASSIKMDAAAAGDVKATLDLAIQTYGRLDVLFNNAGLADPALLTDMSLESWKRVLDVCLTSTFLGIKLAVPLLRRAGGFPSGRRSDHTGELG